jgi:hypothetical protein
MKLGGLFHWGLVVTGGLEGFQFSEPIQNIREGIHVVPVSEITDLTKAVKI